jgi:hypothetical protein
MPWRCAKLFNRLVLGVPAAGQFAAVIRLRNATPGEVDAMLQDSAALLVDPGDGSLQEFRAILQAELFLDP